MGISPDAARKNEAGWVAIAGMMMVLYANHRHPRPECCPPRPTHAMLESDSVRRDPGHVPLIDHNPRGGEKEEFEPADAVRYRERSGAERTNARLKDGFGGPSSAKKLPPR